ncbi:MAG: GTP-binding protein [Lachnospiraceae bacterium]|nr:GTP-binding protein [Lachnospiraceae bacterium]
MTKIDVVSGFLGAGKTTLIKKLLSEALRGQNTVLIENEFGEIGVDGGFLKDAGIEIKEMNSGCICCSLVGDFGTSLHEVLDRYNPDRIIIEPSGVGKLSDVMKAIVNAGLGDNVELNSAVAVVDASKARMYIKNFGEFFNNQIEHAGTIILSRTQDISQEKLDKAIEMIREHNPKATIITTPWDDLDGKDILNTFEGATDLEKELLEQVVKEHDEHEHHHHHDHDEHEHHHHHDHDEDEHEHHHDHGEGCTCGCHDHDHHHHHADEIFTSWGEETAKKFTTEKIDRALDAIEDDKIYGMILRAKGMVPAEDGTWIYFDYVPGEKNIRGGKPDVTGKICVIGSELKEDKLRELFL